MKTHYETLQKDREKDPRAAFAARPNSVSGTANGDTPYGASVVGPMASAGLSLPSVERALERDPDDVTVRLAKLARRVRMTFPSSLYFFQDILLTTFVATFVDLLGILFRGSFAAGSRLTDASDDRLTTSKWSLVAASKLHPSLTCIFRCGTPGARGSKRGSRKLLSVTSRGERNERRDASYGGSKPGDWRRRLSIVSDWRGQTK